MAELELKRSKINAAVDAVMSLASKKDGPQKKNDLLESPDAGNFVLQIILKKIPPQEKSIKLNLPHSISRPDAEVCLFVKDLDRKDRDYEPTVLHFQDLFRQHNVNSITEIVPLKSLKTEYKVFEAKRNLANGYDMFLADDRIMRHLPVLLGKHFLGRPSKIPIKVNLRAKDLAKEINKVIGSSRCIISSKGSSSTATVGHTAMSQSDIVDNVIDASRQLSTTVLGGPDNIKQLLIKTRTSTSVPIYLSKSRPQDVSIPKDRNKDDVEAEEISTLLDAKVKVYPNGDIKIVKDKESSSEEFHRKTNAKKSAVKRKLKKSRGRALKKVQHPRKQQPKRLKK